MHKIFEELASTIAHYHDFVTWNKYKIKNKNIFCAFDWIMIGIFFPYLSLLFTLFLSLLKYEIISQNISVSRFRKKIYSKITKKKMCFNTRNVDTIAAKFIESADKTYLYLTIFYLIFVCAFFHISKVEWALWNGNDKHWKFNAVTTENCMTKNKNRWRNDTF